MPDLNREIISCAVVLGKQLVKTEERNLGVGALLSHIFMHTSNEILLGLLENRVTVLQFVTSLGETGLHFTAWHLTPNHRITPP